MRSGSTVAEVRPVVAEVEDVDELLARLQAAQLRPPVVLDRAGRVPLLVWRGQPRPIGELELVEMRPVPARERVVDRLGQLRERVAPCSGEDCPGLGQKRSPRPSTSSTRIDSHVRAIHEPRVYSLGIPSSKDVITGDVIVGDRNVGSVPGTFNSPEGRATAYLAILQ